MGVVTFLYAQHSHKSESQQLMIEALAQNNMDSA